MTASKNKFLMPGLGFYFLGLLMLPFVDRMASNTAGLLSPFFIIAGWVMILKRLI